MKYLFSVAQETVTETDKTKWAVAGEPVVPWFPAPPENVFISIGTFKKSIYATVEDRPDIDLEALSKSLQKYYPGLTKELLDNYVVATAKVAHEFPVGAMVQVAISTDSAQVYPRGQIEYCHTLWTKQPFKELV